MANFIIRYTKTSYHIQGITEATPASADGMDYAISACASLSRMGSRMAVGSSTDDLATALKSAQTSAKVRNAKMCQHCETAALRLLAS